MILTALRSGWPGVVRYLGMLLLPWLLAGCGSAPVKVSGRVLYDGAPLPGGWVTFRPVDPNHNTVISPIDENGNYEAVLPVGETRVSVDNSDLEPRAPEEVVPPMNLVPELKGETKKLLAGGQSNRSHSGSGALDQKNISGRYVKIPPRYYDAETSALNFTVQAAEPKHDIELTK